jgi:ABC-type glutathione transport system ATPase component
LILQPQVLLLDEPTSALDASVQAEVLNLLEELRRQRQLSFVMVSHDLAVVTHLCQRLMVMQRGRVVETLAADDLAAHRVSADYTRALMQRRGFRASRRSAGPTPEPVPSPLVHQAIPSAAVLDRGSCEACRCDVSAAASRRGIGITLSKALATRRTSASPNIGPTICRPIGKPPAVRPQGTEQAGCCVRLNG